MVAVYPGREAPVVDFDNFRGQITIHRVVPPEGVYIQNLNIDPSLIQLPDSVGAQRPATLRIPLQWRSLHHFGNLREARVGVDINHLHALAAHAHVAMRNRSVRSLCLTLPAALSPALRGCLAHEDTLRDPKPCRRARHALNEISAVSHTLPPMVPDAFSFDFRMSGYHKSTKCGYQACGTKKPG